MGADGGICWVRLKEPYEENAEKLRHIMPWRMMWWDKYYDDFDVEGMGHDLFLDHIPDNTAVCTYGTGQDTSLMDLQNVLDDYEGILEDWGSGDVTLADLLEVAKDKKDPQQWPDYYKSFADMLLESFQYGTFHQEHVLAMTVNEWFEAVKSCCVFHSDGRVIVGWVETWT